MTSIHDDRGGRHVAADMMPMMSAIERHEASPSRNIGQRHAPS